MPYFFLILLTTVLVFISAKPEGFDISNNYVKGATGPVGSKGATGPSGPTRPPGSIQNIIVFTPGNIAIFLIGIVLFIIMIILIIKLNSISSTSS